MSTYFITGATGAVGRETVKALQEKGHTVLAASRHPKESTEQVKHVRFDFADPETFSQVNGTDGIFFLGPPLDPNMGELVKPFLDYIKAKGPKKLVYLSANGMEHLEELPFHKNMEDEIKRSDLQWTILRPGYFMQNFGNYERENIEERNLIFSNMGNGKTAFISTRDIGEAAAESLSGQNHTHKTYTLLGDEHLSYHDAARELSEVTGRQISYPEPDEDTFKNVLKQSGAPDFVADYMAIIGGLVRDGLVANSSDDVNKLINRKPETLRQVLERDFA